jgi:membrane protein YdbS with pleckstrin-like domain
MIRYTILYFEIWACYTVDVLFIIIIMVMVVEIVIYKMFRISGCKYGLTNRLLEPNLFRAEEPCTCLTIQKVSEIESALSKINVLS